MTRIRFRFRRPDGLTDGGSSPRGLVVCSPTSRVVQKDESIMLPLPFVARLPEDGGDLLVSLQPTGRTGAGPSASRSPVTRTCGA